MGQCNFKKRIEFNSFNEIFYCRLARLKSTILGVFIHMQELFYKTGILARVFLRKIQSFKIPLKYLTVA